MAKEYPLLIGCEMDKQVELHNKREVAEYICKKGLEGDVYIKYPNGRLMLNTFGMYIDKIDDMEYRSELLKELISLLLQQLYREILTVADEKGGMLDKRVVFYMDEFGTLPPINSVEMMYSASRSRKLSLVSIIQSYQQLEKNYGREGAAIIYNI